MKSQTKRSYDTTKRQAQALQTRVRILETAKKLFKEEGFDRVTIDKLAKVAQVSSPTVYALFQSKTGLVRALMDEALSKDLYEALLSEGRTKNTPHDWVRIAAKISRLMYDAEAEYLEFFQSASVLSPEIKALEKEREERRYSRQQASIVEMMEKESVKKGLNLSYVRDVAWAFTSRDMYRMLVLERGWSSDQYEKWLCKLLSEQFLEISK